MWVRRAREHEGWPGGQEVGTRRPGRRATGETTSSMTRAARTTTAGTRKPNRQVNRLTRRPHEMDVLRGRSEGASTIPQRSAPVRCMFARRRRLDDEPYETVGRPWGRNGWRRTSSRQAHRNARHARGEQRDKERTSRQSSETRGLHHQLFASTVGQKNFVMVALQGVTKYK